jgi:hypothetical protein
MSRVFTGILIIGCAVALTACANLNSISRSTLLPTSKHGKAVHLDAQQRLLIVNEFGEICAEPSPDAMAAFAAAAALAASVPGTGAASLAGGGQSSIASIGLRTQSITLMRDALYRMCEAYANGAVGPGQIASLLGRSQDLTAVILAVEQLTGAIAANQAALTGTTSASASASLLSNQSLLDAAREDEAEKQRKLEEAEADLAAATTKRNEKEVDVVATKAERDRLNALDPDTLTETQRTEKAEAEAAWDRAKNDFKLAENDVHAAQNLVDNRKMSLAESRQNRETIESAKDSALTSATAATTSASQFSTPVARKELSEEASEVIARAVQAMVQTVLHKDYSTEACMAMLTYVPRRTLNTAQKTNLSEVREVCKDIILQNLTLQRTVTDFGPDDSSEFLKKWSEAPENRTQLKQWLEGKGLEYSPTTLIYGADKADVRKIAIGELGIE